MFTEDSLSVAVEGGTLGGCVLMPHDDAAVMRTPLVVTHGGPGGSCYTLRHTLAPLAAHRPIVFYDQLGSYLSPAPITPALMEPARFGDEMAAVIAHLGVEKAYVLGHSWGGVVAIECARRHPHMVAGAVLSSPLISTPLWVQDANMLLAMLPPDIQDIIQKHEAAGTTDDPAYDEAAMAFMRLHYCRLQPWPDITIEGHKRSNTALYNAMWGPSEFSCTGTLKVYDGMAHLPHLDMPVLLTCGRHDEARPGTMHKAARLLKDARVHVFEHSAHVPYLEETDAYIDVINDFLK